MSKPEYSIKHPLGKLKESEAYTADGEVNPILYISYAVTECGGYDVISVDKDEGLHILIKNNAPPILVYGHIDNILGTENLDVIVTHRYSRGLMGIGGMDVYMFFNKSNNYDSLSFMTRLNEFRAVRKLMWHSTIRQLIRDMITLARSNKETCIEYSISDLKDVSEKINKNIA